MSVSAVMGVQHCEQEEAEPTALWGSCVERYIGGVTSNPNSLGSACVVAQYPGEEC